MSAKSTLSNWPAKAVSPPKLTDQQWGWVAVPGVVLIVMAVCQIITFNDFTDVLSKLGMGKSNVWAAIVIVLELWGSAMFFKIRLSSLFRMLSGLAAFLVSGFWFVITVKAVSGGANMAINNSGFFGKYLHQTPGWWTVIEATVLFVWVLWAMDLMPMPGNNRR